MLSCIDRKFSNPGIESVRKKGTKGHSQQGKCEPDHESLCKPE